MTGPQSLTIDGVLRLVQKETGVDLFELKVLLGHVLNMDRAQLIIHSDTSLPQETITKFKKLASQRAEGEPIAYLTGLKEFYSRSFMVKPSVLIPRPETEELVERALQFLAERSQTSLVTKVLDLGTGSGAIAITLRLENPLLDITATDISKEALSVASCNAKQLGASDIHFIQSDLFNKLHHPQTGPLFDLIVSNPPYIPKNDPHLLQGDLRFEPPQALSDQGDGLHFYREMAAKAPLYLKDNGAVMVEHGWDQQEAVAELFRAAGFQKVTGFADLAGQPRIVTASAYRAANLVQPH